MAKVKICGLQREEDVRYVNEYKPDFVGFIFAKGSRRYITKEKAINLRKLLSTEIMPVGVFVNEELSRIAEFVHEDAIDVVQLHGEEDGRYIASLRELIPGVEIIKAIKVATKEDVLQSRKIPADYLLFDSFLPGQQGGTGNTFDWSFLSGVERPYFLAGGINPANVSEALAFAKPYGVDVSSGVETEGYKDKEKIRMLMEQLRNE